MVGFNMSVAEDNDAESVENRVFRISLESVNSFLEAFSAASGRELTCKSLGLECRELGFSDSFEIFVCENRGFQLDKVCVFRKFLKNVALVADENRKAHYKLFTDGVDRRICYLSKELLEVGEEQLRLL